MIRNGRAELGVRHRVIRNALRKKAFNLNAGDFDGVEPDLPASGKMQLHSYYVPGLPPGTYDIDVVQNINPSNHTDDSLRLEAKGKFTVPNVTWDPLDPKSIHSTFPPPGIPAQNHILPHIVFNDAHLPWQKILDEKGVEVTGDDRTVGIPWLAVIAFEQGELVAGSGSFTDIPSLPGPVIPNPEPVDEKGPNLIFMKENLFQALFMKSSTEIDLSPYKYLAHVRQVNTKHMTDIRNKEYMGGLDTGTFSVIFSPRTGPFVEPNDSPNPCVVHVIALDYVPEGLKKARNSGTDLIPVATLFSWTYDCLPRQTVTFKDTMVAVGNNSGAFGTDANVLKKFEEGSPLWKRLMRGYNLVRFRVQTGEETVALMRGPFTPVGAQDQEDEDKFKWFSVQSNSGEDLQIVDNSLGIIDISYCAAWQIGKALAIADQAFSASLLRIRAEVHNTSSEKRKQDILEKNGQSTRSDPVISRLEKTMGMLTDGLKRASWEREASEKRFKRDPLIETRYQAIAKSFQKDGINRADDIENLGPHLGGIASALDDSASHYTELEAPRSSDWQLVMNWLMDRLYLEGIPAYYLIPEPTWLPSESIRFFYVDKKWLSALIDGALSVCNHLDNDDATRTAIKKGLFYYITHKLHPKVDLLPQLPRYGFYMRSVAVSALQDMVIRAPLVNPVDGRAEVLRQERVGNNVLFCLFDRTPSGKGDEQLTRLEFSQPPHQQCFTFCNESLTKERLQVEVRQVYAAGEHEMKFLSIPDDKTTFHPDESQKCDVYNWSTRTINLVNLGAFMTKFLREAAKDAKFKDLYQGDANAALMGIELNDPVYQLIFTVDGSSSLTSNVFKLPSGPVSLEQNVPGGSDLQALPHGDSSELMQSTSSTAIQATDASEAAKNVFTSSCLTLGFWGSEDKNYLKYTKTGRSRDILFVLKRKKELPSGINLKDYIKRVTLAIPSEIFTKPPGKHDARMLENIRLMPVIREETRNGKKYVVIELIPKPYHDPDAVSTLCTLLEHNDNLTFVLTGPDLKHDESSNSIEITESYKKYGETQHSWEVTVEAEPS